MTEGIIVAIIMLCGSGITGLWAWLKGRRKNEVEIVAQKQAAETARQSALSERFEDADALARYVKEQVDKAVELAIAPLREKIEHLEQQSHRIRDAFRRFFTQLWVWERQGRPGGMPMPDANLLEDLRLAHLLELPFEDTQPVRPKE